MPVAHARERCVAFPAIGQDDGSTLDIRCHEARKGGPRGVRNDLEAHPARGLSTDLDRGHNQRLVKELSASFQTRLRSADVGLIHLDLLLQGSPVGSYHGPPQLVEHGPGGLVGVDTELPLKLERRQTWRV